MSRDRDFQGRVAVVAGGASGIGRACAEALAARGATVVVVDRAAEAARAVAASVGGHAFELDVADPAQVERIAGCVEAEVGPVDCLVSAAGITQGPTVPPGELPIETYDRIFEINLRGTFVVCSAFGTRMAVRGRGAIVNFASIAGLRSTPLHAYGPMKAAIIGLTENLAAEWGRRRVRVNCLSPGPVLTPLLQESFDKGLRDRAVMASTSASGEIAAPAEVAAAALFLLSDEASAITGVNLPVDHGWLVATSWPTFGGLRLKDSA